MLFRSKNMNKRLIAIVLVIVLAFAAFAGCATTTTTTPAATTAATTTAATTTGATTTAPSTGETTAVTFEKHSIGAIFYSKDDSLGAAVYATLNRAAAALNVDLQWKIGDLDPNTQIASAENLVASGVEGLVNIPLMDVVAQKVSQLCTGNDVKFANYFRSITDEAIRAQVEANPNYVGCCFEDEVSAAAQLVKIMVDQGRTKLGFGFLPPGSALGDLRNGGFNKGISEYGVTKLAEYTISYGADLQPTLASIQNFIDSYPDMQGLCAGSASVGQGEAIANLLASSGSDMKLATFDTFSGMKEAFAAGGLAAAAGGMSPDALFTFMMLFNAVDGTPLSDKPIILNQNYIFVTDVASCEAYEKYIDNPDFAVYSDEEVVGMTKRGNPSFTVDAMKSIMADYTMEKIIAKIEG